MHGKYDAIAIQGIAVTVPSQIIDNTEEAIYSDDKRLQKQIRLTGVDKRHRLTKDQTSSDLACDAAAHVLSHTGWSRDSIRALVYVTQTPDIQVPATAFLIQDRLGIGTDCIAFDVNLGCSGFVTGLQIISAILHNSGGRGLLLIADSLNDLPMQNTGNERLFGDAGTAVALESVPGNELYYYQRSDGSRYKTLYKRFQGPVYMNGKAIFAFTLNDVVESIQEFIQFYRLSDADIDYYVLHQGQKLILTNLAEQCGFPEDKVLYSIGEYGNTIGSSIPLTLCSSREYYTQESLRLFMSGFGIGLSWGCIYTTVRTEHLLPIHILA